MDIDFKVIFLLPLTGQFLSDVFVVLYWCQMFYCAIFIVFPFFFVNLSCIDHVQMMLYLMLYINVVHVLKIIYIYKFIMTLVKTTNSVFDIRLTGTNIAADPELNKLFISTIIWSYFKFYCWILFNFNLYLYHVQYTCSLK